VSGKAIPVKQIDQEYTIDKVRGISKMCSLDTKADIGGYSIES
jgi:hypothetical protein